MCTPTPVWCNQHLKSNQFLSSEFPDQLHWFKEKMGDYAGQENYPLNCYFSFTHPYFLVIQWEGCFQTRNAFFSFIVFITFSSSPGQGVWPRWSLLSTVPADLRPHRVPQPRHPLSRLPHPSGYRADDENVHGHHDHDQRAAHHFFLGSWWTLRCAWQPVLQRTFHCWQLWKMRTRRRKKWKRGSNPFAGELFTFKCSQTKGEQTFFAALTSRQRDSQQLLLRSW